MELTQLRYFVTIAETMSFTGAAESLHISQPALSYQMRNLERELGTRLFDRKGRRIELTADGELFLPLAQSVLYRANEAVRVLREHMGAGEGEVRLGCNPSVATYIVPSMLTEFRKDYPHVKVHSVEAGDLDLQHLVQAGTVDFAVVTALGSAQLLDVTPLGTEYLRIITSVRHPFAGRLSLDLRELVDQEFVLAEESYNITGQIRDACRRAGFEPRGTYEASSLEAVKNFVRQGLGVSILPAIALEGLGRTALAVIAVEGGLTRDLSLIVAKDRSLTRAAQVLIAQVKRSVTQHMSLLPGDLAGVPRAPQRP
jgi:LysR family transcriptional regulator, transcription activator of glutamate synthase operon